MKTGSPDTIIVQGKKYVALNYIFGTNADASETVAYVQAYVGELRKRGKVVKYRRYKGKRRSTWVVFEQED
jgi:hypothetical protein